MPHSEEEGITQSQMIHIECINVRDGGAFADNLTWHSNLMARECNCRCFIFWNVGTSFLVSWGSVSDLYDLNKHVGSQVETMGAGVDENFNCTQVFFKATNCLK